MRSLWKGAISFGLIFVPVKMYAATEKKDVKFNFLHKKCGNPIQYRKYCPHCNEEVQPGDMVRGYEYEKGRYVVMSEEDLERLPGEGSRSLEIMDFVDLSEIDPVYFDKAYYLAPGEGGQKVYELLKRAMDRSGKVAVARVVIRSKESLAVLRVANNTLVMNTMFYPDEVRRPEIIQELSYQADLHENEIKMAVNLVENLSSRFSPEKYTDRYREKLMESIRGKITGEEVVASQKPAPAQVVDLMAALKASIEMAREEKEKTKDRPVRRRKTV